MNAYYLTGAVTCSQVRPYRDRYGVGQSFQKWDACTPQIVFGRSLDDAQRLFETWLQLQPEGENPLEVIIRKITQTQFVEKLLTESGNFALDWPTIKKQLESQLESVPVDDFEQGYWVDVDQAVRPDKLSFSAGTLESDVPEDIRSGLNWSSNKQFFFLFSILAPPPPPPKPDTEFESDHPDVAEPVDGGPEKSDELSPEEFYVTFPDACNKEAVALLQARNSVVAAWLWRRYAANTPFAQNRIRIDSWPGTIGNP